MKSVLQLSNPGQITAPFNTNGPNFAHSNGGIERAIRNQRSLVHRLLKNGRMLMVNSAEAQKKGMESMKMFSRSLQTLTIGSAAAVMAISIGPSAHACDASAAEYQRIENERGEEVGTRIDKVKDISRDKFISAAKIFMQKNIVPPARISQVVAGITKDYTPDKFNFVGAVATFDASKGGPPAVEAIVAIRRKDCMPLIHASASFVGLLTCQHRECDQYFQQN